MTKALNKLGIEKIHQQDKGHLGKSISKHHTQQQETENILPKSGTRLGCLISPLLCMIILKGSLSQRNQARKKPHIQIGKNKIKLFTDNQYCIQQFKKISTHTKKSLNVVNKFSKVAGYTINTHIMFSYTKINNSKRKLIKQFHLLRYKE